MAQHRSGGARDLVITYIKGDGPFLKFWALTLAAVDTVKNIDGHLQKIKNELEASYQFPASEQLPVGLKCVVNSKLRRMWCRARVLLHQGYTVLVQLLDYGIEENVPITDVRSMDDQLQSIPAQAAECILADVIPARSNEWTPDAIKFCEEHLLYNTLSCFVVSECLKLPVVRVAKKGESEPFVQRLINSGLALIKPEGTPQPPQPILSYKMNNMDHNSTHLVRVSCIENAYKFYVQLSVSEIELKHLMDTINQIPRERLIPLKAPTVHMPCLAQLNSKPSFYRGLITFIQQTRCKVFFVDYGFTELKDIQELRAIPTHFLNLPAQAICCSLPREAKIDADEFKRFIGFEHLDLTVLNRTTETYIVGLSYRGHDVLSQVPQNYVQQKLQLGAKCEVVVTYVNSLTELYCQLTQLKEQQNIISNILNSGSYNFITITLNDCTPGKPVCAKFSEDDTWYRARVIKANHENDIEVFFVDYGNHDNVNLCDVRKVGADLLKFPIQAFKCFLNETTFPSDPKAQDDAFELLEELTVDQCLLAHVNTFNGDSGYGITLYSKNSTESINERMQSSCLSIPTVSVNSIENVYVTSFDSANSFFAQFEKLDSDKLSEMQEKINSFYSGKQNTSYMPKEGNFVCARFPEDDQYYRARVESCKDGFCGVYFLDYGNRESISIKDVHPMDFSFIEYPQFGIECALKNCPAHVPNDKLSGLILENSFQLNMVQNEKNKWLVSFVENFPGNVTILELLRQNEKTVPRSIHGTGLGGYQEKSASSHRAPYNEPRCNDFNVNENSSVRRESPVSTFQNDVYSNKESPPQIAKPTKEFEDYFDISVPPKAYRNVYVSHVISPGEFYCQIEEDSAKLQSLMKTIEDTYTEGNDLSLSEFVVNAPCCAMYEDGAWYRGKMKKVDSGSCDVFFVDYGNTDSVSKSKIKMLRNDLFRCPSQALKCKAFNVSPKGADWSDDEINAFIDMTLDKSFIAQFVECDSSDVYSVNLISIGKLQDDVFNKDYVNMGYGRLQDTNKTLVLNSHAASTNLSFRAIDVEVGSSMPVQVTFGLNPAEIFCQFKTHEQDFKQMMVDLQNYYNKCPEAESIIDRPHQGMICAAQFFLDSAWYRAEIKKVETNKLVVFYVDYGNSETVDRKKVRCIIQEYTTLPMQAVKCKIRGIKPPGKSWIVNNNLCKYFEGNTVCKFISKENDYFVVDMTCNQKDVAQLLISDRLALSDAPTPNKVESPKRTVTPPKITETASTEVSELPGKVVPARGDSFVSGQLISVTISFIENPSKFWCQLLDECDILTDLMADIEDKISEISPVNGMSLKVGSYCIAQYFEDEAWYRAVIKQINHSGESGTTYKVFFIDYGNSEDVTESQIKVMPPEFMKHPPQCFECCLLNSPSKLIPEMTSLFRDTVEEVEEITAKVEKVQSGVCTVTLLFDKDDQEVNVSELLFGVKEPTEEGGMTTEPPRFLSPDVPLGLQDGYVSSVNSPQDFYIQLASVEDTLAELLTELAEISESAAEVDASLLCVGYACSSKYSEDNNWYRAEVIAINDSTVDVLFVDYGNVDTVDKNSLKSLDAKHLEMVPLAIKCKLNGIVPVAEEWSDEAINTFQDMVLESCLRITFISKEFPATVNISKDDKEISQCLVDVKLANFETCADSNTLKILYAPAKDPESADSNAPRFLSPDVPLGLEDGYVSSVNSPQDFYIQLASVEDTLADLLTELAEISESAAEVDASLLCVGYACSSKYPEDNNWYRAEVIAINDTTVDVLFVDYGNVDTVDKNLLKSLDAKHLEMVPLAIKCKLNGIVPVAEEWSDEAINTFQDMVLESCLRITFISKEVPATVNISKDDKEISQCLVDVKLANVETCADSNTLKILHAPAKDPQSADSNAPRFLSPDVPLGLQDGYVSSVNSPQDFYIQLASVEDTLADLLTELAEISESAAVVDASLLCVGYACSSKYPEDNNWYRAEVIAINDSTVDVLFVDYGNVDTVDKNLLKSLDAKHLEMVPLAIKCKLNGIVPVAEEWSDEAINTFQDMVLESCLGITFISKEVPATVNITKDDKEVSQCLIDMELANVETCAETDEAYAEDHLAPPPVEDPLSSLPNDQSYPERKLLSTNHAVKICYVDSYDKFYVTPLELGTDLETVMNTLEILYTPAKDPESADSNASVPEILEDPKVSMPCVAKYSEDEAWYRAIITEVDGDNIYVAFIDYGNSEITSLSNLRPLTPELVKIPPLALECSLFGIEAVEGQEQAITAKLEEYFVEEIEFEMEIIEFSPYKIKLSYNGDIASMLIKEGLAKERSVIPVESEPFVDSSKMTFVDESLEYRVQISKRFFSGANKIIGNVKFCEIENDLIVFHVVSTDLEDDLQDLQQKLQDAYLEPPQNLANIACMDFCATKYMEDENWYRAQVLSLDKDKVKVRFIDYGNCETVEKSNIYELLSDFISEPQFSVKCILYGLKADKNKEIELQNRLDELVYHDSIELNLCKYSHALCDLCITSLVCGDTSISETLIDEMLVSQQYIIGSQPDGQFKATVQKVTGDIVHLLPLNAVDEREKFQCKLQDISQSLEITSKVQTQYLYAIKIDSIWYRVSVTDISDTKVTVDLVDFGSTKVVDKAEFVLLPLDICHQPLFLQPCIVKPLQDLTGSTKKIDVDLSIGREVMCEAQKTYPIVHPFIIRILEADSNSGETVDEVLNKENVEDEKSCVEAADTEFKENDAKFDEKPSVSEEEIGENIGEKDKEVHVSESEENPVDNEEEFKDNFEGDKENTDEEDKENIHEEDEENIHEEDKENIHEEDKENIHEEDKENIHEEDKENILEEDKKNTEENDEEVYFSENEENPFDEEEFKENIDDEDKENRAVEVDSSFVENNLKSIENVSTKEENDEFEDCAEAAATNTENEEYPISGDLIETVKDKEYELYEETQKEFETTLETGEGENDVLEEKNFRESESNDQFENIEQVEIASMSDEQSKDNVDSNTCEIDEEQFEEESNDPEGTDINVKKQLNQVKLMPETNTVDASEDVNIGDYVNSSKNIEVTSEDRNESYSENFNEEGEAKYNASVNSDEEYVEVSSQNSEREQDKLSYEPDIDQNPPCEIVKEKQTEIQTESRDNEQNENTTVFDINQNPSEELINKTEVQPEPEYYEQNENMTVADIDQKPSEVAINETEVQELQDREHNKKSMTVADINQKSSEDTIMKTDVQAETKDQDQSESISVADKITEGTDINSCGDDSVYIEKDSEGVVNSFEERENNRAIEDSYQLSGSVQVKVSDVAVSNGSVIFAVQPLYLQEEFIPLKESMQSCYSSKTVPYDASSQSPFCIVLHENEWCRGKILQSGDDSCMIMLIDYGKCVTVSSCNVKNLNDEHCSFAPFAVWCTLSSVVCPTEKSETATKFLSDKLKDTDATIKILEGDEPYKINIFIDGSSVLNEMLKNKLVTQKLPNLYLEPGPFRARLSSLNVNSESVQISVILSSFFDDYTTLFEAMQSTYKVEDFVSNVVDSGIYAAYYNDSWYRGLVVSEGNEMQVHLVDTGETVTNCKSLCFLLPEHCLQPAYAIPCHIPFDVKATNEISASVNSVLKASEFLVNIEVCSDSNSVSAMLIDEQIVSEVKNIGFSCSVPDSETLDSKTKNDFEKMASDSSDVKLLSVGSTPAADKVHQQGTSEQLVGYLEETFTTEGCSD